MFQKKSLGQHFLTQQHTLQKIAAALGDISQNTVAEIGPGAGSLTQYLIGAQKLIAYEVDDRLIGELKEKYPTAHIEHQDFLDADLKQFNHNYLLIGNIPYFLTGLIMRKVFEIENYPKSAVFLVQKEYAEKMMGYPHQNFFSNWMQVWGKVSKLFVVKAGEFSPPPKVDSAVVRIDFYEKPIFDDPEKFAKFLKILFIRPRRTILNNLKGSCAGFDENLIKGLEKKRPHELSFTDITNIYRSTLT